MEHAQQRRQYSLQTKNGCKPRKQESSWENSENFLVFLEAASLMWLHMNKQKLFAVLFPALVRIYTNF